MPRAVCFLFALLFLLPASAPVSAWAQMQPHRAEYAVRLGSGDNAPQIGRALQDLSLDCAGWHLKRDIVTEIALTSSWRLSVGSRLDGQEPRSGAGFHYREVQSQNGDEREIRGTVQRSPENVRAEIVLPPAGPQQFTMPPSTMMPIAAIDHLIERLRAGVEAFPALVFDAEVIGDAFLVDVSELQPGTLRPGQRAVRVPAQKSWPVALKFTRGRAQNQAPLFAVTTQVFDTGVLDRLTVDTGLVSVTADLQALEMRPLPTCPRS
jgi:hypothetical protein